MKTIFSETDYKEPVKRIELIQPGNLRNCGEMDVALVPVQGRSAVRPAVIKRPLTANC